MVLDRPEMLQMAQGAATVLPMVVGTGGMLVGALLIRGSMAADGGARIEPLHRLKRGSRRQKLRPDRQEADAERRKIRDALEPTGHRPKP